MVDSGPNAAQPDRTPPNIGRNRLADSGPTLAKSIRHLRKFGRIRSKRMTCTHSATFGRELKSREEALGFSRRSMSRHNAKKQVTLNWCRFATYRVWEPKQRIRNHASPDDINKARRAHDFEHERARGRADHRLGRTSRDEKKTQSSIDNQHKKKQKKQKKEKTLRLSESEKERPEDEK